MSVAGIAIVVSVAGIAIVVSVGGTCDERGHSKSPALRRGLAVGLDDHLALIDAHRVPERQELVTPLRASEKSTRVNWGCWAGRAELPQGVLGRAAGRSDRTANADVADIVSLRLLLMP